MSKCGYCEREAPVRVPAAENALNQDLRACHLHWKVLQNPALAIPFMIGLESRRLRGKFTESTAMGLLEKYGAVIRKLKP